MAKADSSAKPGEKSVSSAYEKYCAPCHHPRRLGTVAPPLLPLFLKKYKDDDLRRIVREGLPATQMPAFAEITDAELDEIVAAIRAPAEVEWGVDDIAASVLRAPVRPRPTPHRNIKDVTAVVERGKSLVWIMEGRKVLDTFDFPNVHGGVKYAADGSKFFVPSRDGRIGRYDIDKGYFGQVRAAVYLRNITLSRDGTVLLAASWLPKALVAIDPETLEPIRSTPVQGEFSAVYELHSRDEALFTFRDRAELGIVDTRTLEIRYVALEEPFEDFFIDPFERYVIGTSRGGKALRVFDLETRKYVFEHEISGLPHLASAAFFYRDDEFCFATSHMRGSFVTVWRMYDWGFVKQVDIGGNGFLVRTHPGTPYLWADNGTDRMVLIAKNDLSTRKLCPAPGKKAVHTEFSGDGSIAYVSVYETEGALVLYDSSTLEEKLRFDASEPIGKYNFVCKQRRFEPVHLGGEVFLARCWGCHHETQEAFGPSLKKIAATRSEEDIRAQIVAPEHMHERLGYERNSMPQQPLTIEELEALMYYIREAGHAEDD